MCCSRDGGEEVYPANNQTIPSNRGVLEQAELVGSRIKRRPYGEYIDEIGKTGLCRLEAFGFGLYLDGKLTFYPNYQVALVKPVGANVFEVHALDPNPETGSQPN
jgi:hypothetical protein